jgi:hypothetical protein
MKKMVIKIYQLSSGSKMCEINIDGEKHLTADIRYCDIYENNIEICTSKSTIYDTCILTHLIDDGAAKYYDEVEVNVLVKDWKKDGISHTIVNNILFTKEWKNR